MKRKLITIIAALAVIASLAACGKGTPPPKPGILVVTNNTGEDLIEFDISPASEAEEWAQVNLFDGKVVKNGESIDIPTTAFHLDERYDLAFGSEDNLYFKMEVDVKKVGYITVDKSDIYALDE